MYPTNAFVPPGEGAERIPIMGHTHRGTPYSGRPRRATPCLRLTTVCAMYACVNPWNISGALLHWHVGLIPSLCCVIFLENNQNTCAETTRAYTNGDSGLSRRCRHEPSCCTFQIMWDGDVCAIHLFFFARLSGFLQPHGGFSYGRGDRVGNAPRVFLIPISTRRGVRSFAPPCHRIPHFIVCGCNVPSIA